MAFDAESFQECSVRLHSESSFSGTRVGENVVLGVLCEGATVAGLLLLLFRSLAEEEREILDIGAREPQEKEQRFQQPVTAEFVTLLQLAKQISGARCFVQGERWVK